MALKPKIYPCGCRQTVAYADLTDEEYQWILDFIEKGGQMP
jgi:hypothetical protein